MSEGYVYIIEDEPSICKIGVSKYFPELRNQQLSTSFHREFKIRGYCISGDIYRDEKIIHALLKDFRVRGEWFKLSYLEIIVKLGDLYEFDHYQNDEKSEEIKGKLIKRTVYLTQEVNQKLTQFHAKRVLKGIEENKYEIICNAIESYIEREEG